MEYHKGTRVTAYSVANPLLGKSKFCECSVCREVGAEARQRIQHRTPVEARGVVAEIMGDLEDEVSGSREAHLFPCACHRHRDDR